MQVDNTPNLDEYILGISAFYHDSAACILKNGQIIFAIQEERLSRKKHDASFPSRSINACLEYAEINIDELSAVVYYEKPFLKFNRIIDTFVSYAPKGFYSFLKAMKTWMKQKIWIKNLIAENLNYSGKILFSTHHESHAAGAFFMSPLTSSAILVLDGVGEYSTISIFKGEGNKIQKLYEQVFPHSLGLLYSAFTQYCGFRVNSGEYKLMGLAAYGKPLYKDLIINHLIETSAKGEIKVNLKYFDFETGSNMINSKFEDLLGKKRRLPESELSQFYKDVASSIQEVLEEVILKIAVYAKKITSSENLCLSGGVALNCKANQKIKEANIFKNVWVQPAAGDAGTAAGAALIAYHHHFEKERIIQKGSLQNQIYLGKAYSNEFIESILDNCAIKFQQLENEDLINKVAQLLFEKNVIGWFQGRMEFGPRALGARSILASPHFADMQKHLNLKIKKRESFRPFAPLVAAEFSADWFEEKEDSKYMLFTANAKRAKEIPSCVHVDGTSRIQTLNQSENPLLHQLLLAFNQLSQIPILINTSFNLRGEPIVESPMNALNCFYNCEMDFLVLGNFLISKKENKQAPEIFINTSNYELD